MKKIKEKLKDRRNLVAFLGILGILLITVGVSYSFFSYSRNGTTENTISSGAIKFIYTEENPGITLEDAMPMTDAQGKVQNDYFDFKVTSKVGSGIDIPYVVTARKTSDSTLPEEYVKVWLSDWSNNEIEQVKKYDALPGYTNATLNIDASKNEKLLYEGIVPRNSNNYNKQFRLRMWIADDIDMNSNNDGVSIYNDTKFTIRVNVYAEGEARSDEDANSRSNANIQSISVDGNNVTKVDNTHYAVSIFMDSSSESMEVPIVVNTQNSNATVNIEKVNSIGQVIKEDGIKMLSTTKNVTVNSGTNYFKITVRPEDKSEPTIYYLTINGSSSYSITYNLDGGTNPSNARTSYTPASSTYTLPTPTKEHYWFDGWYENAEFTGTPVTKIANGSSGDKAFYAKWSEKYFETDSWETIVANVQAGHGDRYAPIAGYAGVQAKRPIEMVVNGNTETHYLRVSNTTECNGTNSYNSNCGFVIEFADFITTKKMKNGDFYTSNATYGGYPSSDLYTYVNGELTTSLLNALPSVVVNAMLDTTSYCSKASSDPNSNNYETSDNNGYYVIRNQKLYLLSSFDGNGASAFDYYRLNSDNRYRYEKRYTDPWWTCDAASVKSSSGYYSSFYTFGSQNGSSRYYEYEYRYDNGVSPAFRIGIVN